MGLAVFGFHMLFLLALAVWHRRPLPPAPLPVVWPPVLVQLPIFNERYVVERLIDAAAALDYPSERLLIQVLDDSTDDTAALARARVAYHHSRGRNLTYLRRSHRNEFKAGALAWGLAVAGPADFVAVFDADFIPPPSFLRSTIPPFLADPRLGMLQTRWDHLNPTQQPLTRAQALAADGYFMVDQVARSRAGLLMNFNGSAGVWRRTCIEEAGGWQGDTLAEDLDLSYRAQLKGWRLDYRADIAVPAELPPSIMALKRQQFRWAKGSFQVLRKLGRQLLTARMSPLRKGLGLLHVAGFFVHPLMLLTLVTSLPVVLVRGVTPLNLGWLGLAGLAPLLVGLWGQFRLRRDWPRRMLYYPALIFICIGLALTNTHAMWEAFFGRSHDFARTPKFSSANQRATRYALPLDWTTWGELILAFYALAVTLLAVEMAPGLTPFTLLYALGFGYTAALGFWQSGWRLSDKWSDEQITNEQ
jgi:cellulose synthase/poly-beta-1,6-N-acetylglucosamine synthase-like glycosyltransferase